MRITANGIDMHYEVSGEGPWLTFSHSLAADISMWKPQIEAFSSRYRILAYDTRGHGQTQSTPGAYTLELLAEDLKALLDGLGIRETHFVGLSMGGMIGQTFALRYPGILRSLTLADTTSNFGAQGAATWEGRIKAAREGGMEPLVDATLGRWLTEPFRKKHPDRTALIGTGIRQTSVDGYAGCAAALAAMDTTARLKDLRCPALVVYGEQDQATPGAMSETLARAIPGSRFEVLSDAAHLASFEQPERFNEALSDFLGSLPASAK